MFNQHAKWLKVCNQVPWRKPIAPLNYLLTSHVWRQDHNGFSHQAPGFIDHVASKGVRADRPPCVDVARLTAATKELGVTISTLTRHQAGTGISPST